YSGLSKGLVDGLLQITIVDMLDQVLHAARYTDCFRVVRRRFFQDEELNFTFALDHIHNGLAARLEDGNEGCSNLSHRKLQEFFELGEILFLAGLLILAVLQVSSYREVSPWHTLELLVEFIAESIATDVILLAERCTLENLFLAVTTDTGSSSRRS